MKQALPQSDIFSSNNRGMQPKYWREFISLPFSGIGTHGNEKFFVWCFIMQMHVKLAVNYIVLCILIISISDSVF